ncbi:MAG: glycosyltransferase [Anaerotignaceae bacterium]
MNSISLCMIVKNEEKYIEQCLSSVASIVKEIIIVDTGSTDNTLELARRFNPKVFEYPWDSNFGNARNHSLAQATGDWILVLDADEAIYSEDLEKLTDIVQTTKSNEIALKFHNFTSEVSEENYNTHIGVRLFKNYCFRYEGAIHEQLVPTNEIISRNPYITDIRVRHYGYLRSNAGQKKRERNVPIIQKILDENPNDSFQLFNMGNEYMSLDDFNKALYYFEKAYANKNVSLAYCPHLIFRRAACLHYLNRNEESLKIIEEGLKLYPKCTDYEYFRGIIYKVLKRYTLAIDSFNKCIAMGAPPPTLSFFNDTEGFRAFVELGNIYYFEEDFAKALSFYLKAIKSKNNQYGLIYKIGEVLNKIYADKNMVGRGLENLFANWQYITNLLVMIDVLLNERLYKQGVKYFEKIQSDEAYTEDIDYLRGRIFFYGKEYAAAFDEFIKVISSSSKGSMLPEAKNKAFEYAVICCMACKQNGLVLCEEERIKPFIQALDDNEEKQILLYFLEKSEASFEDTSKANIYRILSEILQVAEFDLFQQSLEVLNLINSKEVLLDLATVYYKNGYKELALKNILRSVKELDVINANAVQILSKEFLVL